MKMGVQWGVVVWGDQGGCERRSGYCQNSKKENFGGGGGGGGQARVDVNDFEVFVEMQKNRGGGRFVGSEG